MTKLAIAGGNPLRTKPFPARVNIGDEEREAVVRVIDSKVLSQFLGCWHDHFLGGREVRALEEEWADYVGARHAIAVNSCTSGLYCAVGAIGTEPGDEIIVPPYTMSATATAPLIFGAVPIFADIDEETFCLDPLAIEAAITDRTRAIMAVDLFGHPFARERIAELAAAHGLRVIEDCAQAPGARYGDRFAGTLGDIGVFSLNYHKHIHCGEGGIVVTDDDELAERVRLIRNHAEAVVEAKGVTNLVNMVGFNFRMTELEAAVARCQLRKLEGLLQRRERNVTLIEQRLSAIPALTMPTVRPACRHVYYDHAIRFDEQQAGISRDRFVAAVCAELVPFEKREAEGVPIGAGYVKPLYLQPMFQQRIAYGSKGAPFSTHGAAIDYSKGICPVTERMHERELFTHEFMLPSMTETDIDDVANAFEKVWELRQQLEDA